MKTPSYEFVTICGWCGVELDRQPSDCKTLGVSHGVCERCYRAVLRPQILAVGGKAPGPTPRGRGAGPS